VAHGLHAQALREEQHRGYSTEEAAELRGVFDAYDVNRSRTLEATELGKLLEDMGQAPKSVSEQQELRAILERILGGSLRPLRFREFLELAKIMESTTIGSGGEQLQEQRLDHRRSSDRMELARRAGLTMADVMQFQEIFAAEATSGSTLSSIELYELLGSRLRLHAAESEREQQVHWAIEKYASSAGSLDFEDFLAIVGDLVDANLATVPSLLGRQHRSTNHFVGNLAALFE